MTDPSTPPTDWGSLRAALAAAPEITTSPSASTALVQSTTLPTPADPTTGQPAAPDPSGNAQALWAAIQQHQTDMMIAKAHHGNWFTHIVSGATHGVTGVWNQLPGVITSPIATVTAPIGSAIGTVASAANYPLQQVQHTYRYYHDVAVHKGVGSMFGEMTMNAVSSGLNPLGVIAAPYLTHTVQQVTGQTGNVPSAVPGFTAYSPESWDRSKDAVVSPGRDLAGLFELKHGSVPYNLVSGTGDAAFDLTMDPVMRAGEISKALTLSNRAIATTTDLERVASGSHLNPLYAPVHRAIQDMADTTTVQGITDKYPKLRYIPAAGPSMRHGPLTEEQALSGLQALPDHSLAHQLAQAHNYDAVVDVLRDHLAAGQNLGATVTPQLSLTRIPFRKLNEMSKSWQLPKTAAVDDWTNAARVAKGDPNLLDKAKSRLGYAVKTFVNDTPFALQDGKIVGEGGRIDVNNPAAPDVLAKLMRHAHDDRTAVMAAESFANASTEAEKVGIWNRALASMADAAGVPDDPAVRADFMSRLHGQAHLSGAGGDSTYVVDKHGFDHSSVSAKGVSVNAAVYTSQAATDVYIPKYIEDFVSPARELRGGLAMYGGRADDFLRSRFIPFFSRNALATGGYALRNSLNEDMTAVMGAEGMGTLRALVEGTAARMGHKLLRIGDEDTETDAVIAAMGDSADKEHWLQLRDDPSYAQLYAEQILRHNGHIRPEAVSASHTATAMAGNTAADHADNIVRSTIGHRAWRMDPNRWVKIGTNFGISRYSNAVSSHAILMAQDSGMRRAATTYRATLRELTENNPMGADRLTYADIQEKAFEDTVKDQHDWLLNSEAGKFARSRMIRAKYADTPDGDPLWDWARNRVHGLAGLTTNPNGDVIHQLLDGVADSAPGIDHNALSKTGNIAKAATHENLRPSAVRELTDQNLPLNGVPGMDLSPMSLSTGIPQIVDKGFEKVLQPTINWLARNPIYITMLKQEFTHAQRLPMLTRDEAMHLAETRATERMILKIHNPSDRSEFAQLARNFIPFFFARQQSYQRLGRALKENPLGFRPLQLAYHGMKDTGFVHTDPTTGEDQFTYPVTGELGKYLPAALAGMGRNVAVGIPSGFTGNITSLAPGGDVPGAANTSAGFSPLVTMGVKGLASVFPEMKGIVPKIVGQQSADAAWWTNAVPNAPVRNIITAYAGDHTRAFVGSMIDAIQYQAAHGNPPPDRSAGSQQWQTYIDGIRGQTRAMFLARALFGIGSPTSPILENGDGAPVGLNITKSNRVHLTQEYQSYLTKYGLSDGTQRFLVKYPNATSYTMFKTESSPGENIPETQAALDWAKTNTSFIKANPVIGTLFVPQTQTPDPNALSVWQQQMAAGLRHEKTPDEFAQQLAIQDGWNTYETQHTNFLNSIAALDPNSDAVSAAHTAWAEHVTNDLAPAHPLWLDDYNSSNVRDGEKALHANALVKLVNDAAAGKATIPESPMTQGIVGLVKDYETYQAQSANNTTGQTKTELRNGWNTYLGSVLLKHPELTTVVNRIFKGL